MSEPGVLLTPGGPALNYRQTGFYLQGACCLGCVVACPACLPRCLRRAALAPPGACAAWAARPASRHQPASPAPACPTQRPQALRMPPGRSPPPSGRCWWRWCHRTQRGSFALRTTARLQQRVGEERPVPAIRSLPAGGMAAAAGRQRLGSVQRLPPAPRLPGAYLSRLLMIRSTSPTDSLPALQSATTGASGSRPARARCATTGSAAAACATGQTPGTTRAGGGQPGGRRGWAAARCATHAGACWRARGTAPAACCGPACSLWQAAQVACRLAGAGAGARAPATPGRPTPTRSAPLRVPSPPLTSPAPPPRSDILLILGGLLYPNEEQLVPQGTVQQTVYVDLRGGWVGAGSMPAVRLPPLVPRWRCACCSLRRLPLRSRRLAARLHTAAAGWQGASGAGWVCPHARRATHPPNIYRAGTVPARAAAGRVLPCQGQCLAPDTCL